MKIYFSGIGGVGIGPLAEIASDAGHQVIGSDMSAGLMSEQLESRGIRIYYEQSGDSLRQEHTREPIDLFVHTAALPPDHPELAAADKLGIKIAKRDELMNQIITERNLKLIAVAGTHGKTTTTGLLVWVMQQLGLPVSYLVGTTLSFGPSGQFDPKSEYFVYECDEFDRNFLKFKPSLSIITALDYDHPDTYPTPEDYRAAFVEFMEQSDFSLIWQKDLRFLKHPDIPASYEAYDELMDLSHISLPGQHVRQNAFLVEQATRKIFYGISDEKLLRAINSFPGTARRFEKLCDHLYTDYGHHPNEIAAILQLSRELSDHVVLVYQPHQNRRQHEVRDQYTDELFKNADEIYWLPTYLSRENQDLEILSPEILTGNIAEKDKIQIADMDDQLAEYIRGHLDSGHLVVAMGAGSIDKWARDNLQKFKA